MNQNEYSGLLRHVRGWVTEIGRADLDHLAYAATEGSEVPSQAAQRYLEALTAFLALESRQGVQLALSRLGGSVVSTEDRALADIMIEPSDEDRRARDLPQLSLSEVLPDRSELIEALSSLLIDLKADDEIR